VNNQRITEKWGTFLLGIENIMDEQVVVAVHHLEVGHRLYLLADHPVIASEVVA